MARITKNGKRSWNVEREKQSGRTFENPWYHTVRWRKLRLSVLGDDPLCRLCAPRVTLARVVDHVIPVSSGKTAQQREQLMWERTNLQGLCDACHNSKSGKEKILH